MTTAAKNSTFQKKGGTRFPRVALDKALLYATKLVSKTHTGPQAESIILPGVFGKKAESGKGRIELSALRQFGLLEGKADAIKATDLARQLTVTEGDEKAGLLARACLIPPVFKTLFDTFHGDSVTVAKVKQSASSLNVHPDSLEVCVSIFADSCVVAGLAKRSGDDLVLVAAPDAAVVVGVGSVDEEEDSDPDPNDALETGGEEGKAPRKQESQGASGESTNDTRGQSLPPSARSVVHVNITVDSSMDTEKLLKQLELLKRFGAL